MMNLFQSQTGKWVVEFDQAGEIPGRSIVFDRKEDAEKFAEPWLKLQQNATISGPLFEAESK
jgi:hypothetical protein